MHLQTNMGPFVKIIRKANYTFTWWRHQMEVFSALLALCAGNSPVPGEFHSQRPVTRSFDIFFDLCLNERLSTQSWGWWFETPSRSLWHHCNDQLFKSLWPSRTPYSNNDKNDDDDDDDDDDDKNNDDNIGNENDNDDDYDYDVAYIYMYSINFTMVISYHVKKRIVSRKYWRVTYSILTQNKDQLIEGYTMLKREVFRVLWKASTEKAEDRKRVPKLWSGIWKTASAKPFQIASWHYSDVIMGAMASQITNITIVYSIVYSGADRKKHQCSASLAFVEGIHWWPVNSPPKGPVTRKMFPFDDAIMPQADLESIDRKGTFNRCR